MNALVLTVRHKKILKDFFLKFYVKGPTWLSGKVFDS